MHFPQHIYLWLLSLQSITNTGQQDEKGTITLTPNVTASFDNGYLIADIIKRMLTNSNKPIPPSLATIKNDASRSTKLTNWNFIWLAFQAVELRMDTRIKELILQGEQALIVEVVRQLYEKDQRKPQQNNKASIRIRSSVKPKNQQHVDIKKLNLSKDPQQSQTSLQFLMLLLKASLDIGVQQILGLFTNQNKYLAHLIVKGINDNFDPIILFYTLLIKHANKLKSFYQQNSRDAEACLYAIKPGFISKSEQVANITIDLFSKLDGIYGWFIGQGMCAATFFLGTKRHSSLKKRFWVLLQQIIKDEEVPFFTKHFPNSFQSTVEQIQVTTILIQLLAQSQLREKLINIGIIASWLQVAVGLKEDDIQAQIICFRFIGQLMIFLPDFIQQNEDSLQIFQRKWFMKTLPQFATLFNELIVILQRLGEERSSMASKIYQCITLIARSVGAGDKRDYLVQNFLPLVSKFPTIPTEYLIQHLKRTPLSNSQFLLVCQSIQINENIKTLVSVGNFMKALLLQNPLLNFYLSPMLKEVIQKVIKDEEEGSPFVDKLMEQALQLYSNLDIKFKSKLKHPSLSFGKKDNSQKANKLQDAESAIKQKWKEIIIAFVMQTVNVVNKQQNNELKQSVKQKLLNANSYIKFNNFKVGSKQIQDALSKKFAISKEEQHQQFEQYSKKASADLSESAVRSLKPISHVTVATRLKGPQNLTKQFQHVSEKRRQEEQQRKIQQLKKKALEEKKKLSVKKELQITNLLRGQIGEAQLRDEGYLQRLIQDKKQIQVIPPSELEERQLQSIDATFKKYHRVLRHLFLTYTWTMYSGHANQKFEDNQQRKQILTTPELMKLLKDYRLAFLTNQNEVSLLIREINIKLLNKREGLGELDYSGFEQFIIQFCALIMTRTHTITITGSQGKSVAANNFKNQPTHIIVKQFFKYLKSVFIARGQKITVFDETADVAMSKEQAEEVEAYNKKVENRPDYILPKGYKKVTENTIEFTHRISNNISGIPEAYLISVQILDMILSQSSFSSHIIQSLSQKKTIVKVKPNTLGGASAIQKERAMSTYIEKKSPLLNDFHKRRSSSRGIIAAIQKIPASQRNLGEQAAAVLEDIIEKVQANKEKEQQKQRRFASMAKLQQLEKNKQEVSMRKAKEKEEQKQAQLEKQKEEEQRRRAKTERFLEEQRSKLAEKKRKEEEEQMRKAQQEEEKEALKRQNKEKFKMFHQGQVEKIKKIEESALQKLRKERIQLEESKQHKQQQRRKLKEQIQEDDKRIIQFKKQCEKNIQALYESQPIKKTFTTYQPNLKALFDFLIQNTYVSLTEKKHNHEIIFQTWRRFLSNFQFTALIHPKDVAFIFKNLTKGKLVSKDYYVGLTYAEFQQALLRMAIKYKSVFNIIADRIKEQDKPSKEQAKKEQKEQKEQNEFQNINEGTIKDILKQNMTSRDAPQEYDTAQVTHRTLLALIYYLKVPKNRQGQEKRFRQILAMKHPTFAHQTDRLKEKLSEQYTLDEPVKKIIQSKVLISNGQTSQVPIK